MRPLLRCNGREAETVAFSVYSNSDSERAFPASRFRGRSQNSDGSDGGMAARTFAVAKTWAVERNGARGARGLVKYSTDQHVLDHDAVPMQEHHGRSAALLDVMQSHTL